MHRWESSAVTMTIVSVAVRRALRQRGTGVIRVIERATGDGARRPGCPDAEPSAVPG